MKNTFKKINLLFFINIILIVIFLFVVQVNLDSEMKIPYNVEQSIYLNILSILTNNLLAVSSYIVPILGFGKFILDIYITVYSIKVFIIDNRLIDFFVLFIPHFFFEFYAMNIIVFLFFASIIEVLERNFI
ncbi:hypothetical protein [Kurthia sibirica]|uniref:Uncharacterized protein n=1 Tax=Kurthia sibirica TaxID=202750 RepID=A0A2U3AG54_9BACL|nr:hypothetical protein [Kurthia sibirica]PWI23542.1 hypothetical protein DEX24_16005 [Kurthia sibirica]GEK35646.1 hypothetical protein KSI01_31790 [Kurthia sibirica]